MITDLRLSDIAVVRALSVAGSTQLLFGNVLVFVLLIIVAGIAYQGVTTFDERASWVAHTREVIVIGKAFLIEKLLVDMETGERGFLLSSREELLEP